MRRVFCIALAILVGFPSSVRAADWWWLGTFGTAPTRMNAYAENETARSDGKQFIELWLFTHLEQPERNGEKSAMAHVNVDCLTRTWNGLRRTSYDATGREIGSGNLDRRPMQVTAGTMADALVRIACGASQPLAQLISDPSVHSAALLAPPTHAARTPPAAGLSTGTGFFVGAAGHVLTSHHVIEGASRIACRMPAGQIYPATFVRGSPANDVALLRVNARPSQYLGFAPPGSLREGDRVFTVGFPAVDLLGLEPRFTDGTVSALSFAGENAFLQTSIPIQPGNSGGPVVTERGQVVGIIAATAAIEPFYRETGSLPQNVNWAIKAEYASPLLGQMPPAPVRTRDEAITLVRNSVCLIVAER